MARVNRKNSITAETAEGGPAFAHMKPLAALRRSVMSCFLWEDEFYEDGISIAERIDSLAEKVAPADLAALAIQARNQFNLRHVPLLLLVVLARTGSGTPILSNTMPHVLKRVDDMTELLALYWKANPRTAKQAAAKSGRGLSAQMKKGLAASFANFNEYHFAKYDREDAVKLRDVLFLAHPDPGGARLDLFKKIATRTLETPDTWEVGLSAGGDKKATFERLLREGKLGYLALLRNLRNMATAGCDDGLVRAAIVARKGGAERVLPFRYVAAARAAPQYERELDTALMMAIRDMPGMSGTTVGLIDVSGSMGDPLSAKSDMRRVDAAAALGSMIPGDVRLFTFSDKLVEVPPRKGMAGVDAIINSQPHRSTYLGRALAEIDAKVNYDRIIVVTDEQTADKVKEPKGRGYMINVASNKNGVGYGGRWTQIDGFSEAIFNFIREIER